MFVTNMRLNPWPIHQANHSGPFHTENPFEFEAPKASPSLRLECLDPEVKWWENAHLE